MKSERPFQENADLICLLENAPPTGLVEVPPQVYLKLEGIRREFLAAREPGEPSASLAPAEPCTVPVTRHKSSVVRAPFRQVMQWAAALAILAGMVVFYFLQPGGKGLANATARIVLTSPQAAAVTTQPVIALDFPGCARPDL